MGSAIFTQMSLACIRKLAEQTRERESKAVRNIHSSCGKTLPSRSQHLTGPSVFYTGVQVTVGIRKVPKQRLNEFLSALESHFRT